MDNKPLSKSVEIISISADDFHKLLTNAVTTAVDFAIQKSLVPIEEKVDELIRVKIYTAKEASEILRVHGQTMKSYLHSKLIGSSKRGGKTIITHKNLMDFIEKEGEIKNRQEVNKEKRKKQDYAK